MSFKRKVDLLRRFDYYVRNECTGSPKDFAQKLRTSVSTVYRMKEIIEFLGGEIEYSEKRESYRYKNGGCLNLGFNISDIENPSEKFEEPSVSYLKSFDWFKRKGN